MIIVDDGSTDDSKKVIEKYLSDNRVKYIRHNENKGIPTARNTGIRASRGKYVAFLDQDDLWLPSKLEEQAELFEKDKDKKIGLVFTDLVYFNSDGKTFKRRWPDRDLLESLSKKSRKDILVQLFKENFIPSITAMIRKRECLERLGLLNEKLHGADEYEYWLRIAGNFEIKYLDKLLVKKFVHKNSAAVRYAKEGKAYEDLITIVHEAVKHYPFLDEFKNKKLARLHYIYGRCLFSNSRIIKARGEFLKALRYNFLHWRACLSYILTLFGKFGQSLNFELKAFKNGLFRQ